MPGLTGGRFAERRNPEAARVDLRTMTHELVEAPGSIRRTLDGSTAGENQFVCLANGRPLRTGVAEREGSRLAVEGYVYNADRCGDELAEWLLERFLTEGEPFASALRGSFQIAIDHLQATYLIADPLATRRLFYARHREGVVFSPEVAPLLAILDRTTLDPANLVRFLISGRFFAGESLWTEIRQLLPGEMLICRRGGVERREYFRYEFSPEQGRFDPQAAVEELESLLERAILEAWARARNPTFLLSGGFDSRYIFYTVADAVDDPTRLHTAIWGEEPSRPGSDCWTASRIAQTLDARHLSWSWGVDGIPEHFEAMFRAQSGMTDFALTHVEDLLRCQTLRREHGIEAMFRGDEVFGPQKPEVHNTEEALASLGMHRSERIPGVRSWLHPSRADFLVAHDARLEVLLGQAPEDPADLRDTLYARERLPAFQQHLNYHREHEIEAFNPLLDSSILHFYQTVPAPYRLGKKLFKMAFQRRFGHLLEALPIATCGNPIDWSKAFRSSAPLVNFLRSGLETLPPPLSAEFFLDQLRVAGQAAGSEGLVTPQRLVMRAFVLGRWLREGSG